MKLEITQEEALRLAPMLMPTIQELVREELPEELQDRLLDEMNRRAVRALSEIPQGEYAALAEATLKRIHQEDSTNLDLDLDLETAGTPNSPDGAKPATGDPFRMLISHVDGHATALLVCLKCQKVLMDTGPGFDTDTPEGVRCDHTNGTTLMEYLGEDRTEDLEL